MKLKSRQEKAYDFFTDRCADKREFTLTELAVASGWSLGTVRTYPSKQWEEFLEKTGPKRYKVRSTFSKYSLEVFRNLNSQKQAVNKDPFKPLMDEPVERMVKKAREAALCAVQIFNSPFLEFRTPSFLVHMVIAWGSLFHSIFEEAGTEYWYKNDDGTDVTRDGHRIYWDLSRCLKEFHGQKVSPERKNLEAFIHLRNEVEHRFAPQFDVDFSAECQACLLNFEHRLVENFGEFHSISERVSVPLQISRTSSKARVQALRELQSEDYEVLKERLNLYRASLSEEVYGSQDYAFRVYLVPKPANRASSADMTMEFLRSEDFDGASLSELQEQIALIKTKRVAVANQGLLRPGQVVERVQESEPKFRIHEHTLAWKAFKVRETVDTLDPRYCVYDEPNQQVLYTQAWVEKLAKFCKNPNALTQLREMLS